MAEWHSAHFAGSAYALPEGEEVCPVSVLPVVDEWQPRVPSSAMKTTSQRLCREKLNRTKKSLLAFVSASHIVLGTTASYTNIQSCGTLANAAKGAALSRRLMRRINEKTIDA